MNRQPTSRRSVLVGLLLAAGALTAVGVLPAAAGSKTTTNDHLDVRLAASNPGPLPACSEDGSDCTLANSVRHVIYIWNKGSLPDRTQAAGTTRTGFLNALVVNRIDETVFVDGVETYDFFYTPPPNPNYQPYSGHWPATATCPPEGPPCNNVTAPAVLPGERTVIFWTGWTHGDQEPNGTYVFRYTIHGTLDGSPVDLTADTPPIEMTP